MSFLPEVVEKNVSPVFVIEVEDTVVPRTKFPYVLFQMLCDRIWNQRPLIFKKLDAQSNLLMLYPCVFIGNGFELKVIYEIINF